MEKWEDAERAFRKELELDADSALAHTGLGRVTLQNGEYAGAVEELLVAISLWQSQPNAHFLLGTALAKLGRYQDAIRAFERSLDLAPDRKEIHARLAELYDQIEAPSHAPTRHRPPAID
jgi:tetratricopeptide (TPR) repeat protein